MPQISLLSWAGYTPDVVVSSSIVDAAQLAQHPLDDGARVTDHLFLLPVPVQADVIFSDLPGDGTAYRKGRADELYLALLQELGKGTKADLVTGIRAFPDMVLTEVRRVRSTAEGAARLSLRWDPVRTASSQEVAVPLPHTSSVAAGKVNAGKKTPAKPAPATVTKSKSYLLRLLGG